MDLEVPMEVLPVIESHLPGTISSPALRSYPDLTLPVPWENGIDRNPRQEATIDASPTLTVPCITDRHDRSTRRQDPFGAGGLYPAPLPPLKPI